MEQLSQPQLKEMLPPKGKGAKILITGRKRRFNRSLQELLLLHGYESHIALTEQEAVFSLEQCHYDLVMLNFKMIETGGQQLMEQIKSKAKASKLIMLSDDAVFDKAVWALRQGADDFFRVPYAPDELLYSIHKLLSHKASKQDSHRNQDRLVTSGLLHRFMINNSPDVIYLLNPHGQFTFFNKQVRRLLGFSRKELLGEHFTTLIHPEDLEKSRYTFSERRTGERVEKNVELRLRQKNAGSAPSPLTQSEVHVACNAIGVYKKCEDSKQNIFLGTYGVVRDISKRKAREEESYHQLYHDALTNLPNRSLFQDRLRLALCQNRRNKQTLAVMFLDIDGFKGINDSFGHACGDTLLQVFSDRLKSCLREGDTLARISGDEFNILIPQVNSRQDTEKIARKIIDEFKVPFKLEHREVTIGVSIGIALSLEDSDSDKELIQKADWAMYHVKQNGKNGFAHYTGAIRWPDHNPSSTSENIQLSPNN
ncbi:MAG: diguanylate cyclase [Thermodesulfobacteriota bacterium]|nr:diguanylate cyclase [Thermodesulfobacteriota bacterium]